MSQEFVQGFQGVLVATSCWDGMVMDGAKVRKSDMGKVVPGEFSLLQLLDFLWFVPWCLKHSNLTVEYTKMCAR